MSSWVIILSGMFLIILLVKVCEIYWDAKFWACTPLNLGSFFLVQNFEFQYFLGFSFTKSGQNLHCLHTQIRDVGAGSGQNLSP